MSITCTSPCCASEAGRLAWRLHARYYLRNAIGAAVGGQTGPMPSFRVPLRRCLSGAFLSPQAVAGVGIDWTFADETDVPFGTVLVRMTAAIISIGGMLITALMLGLTSGDAPSLPACPETQPDPFESRTRSAGDRCDQGLRLKGSSWE